MTQTTELERLTDNELDMIIDWANEHPHAARGLFLKKAAVLPFERGDVEQMGALYGKIGYAHVRLSFQEARLDK